MDNCFEIGRKSRKCIEVDVYNGLYRNGTSVESWGLIGDTRTPSSLLKQVPGICVPTNSTNKAYFHASNANLLHKNYQLLCGSCNRIKGDRPMAYLMMKIDKINKLMKYKVSFETGRE